MGFDPQKRPFFWDSMVGYVNLVCELFNYVGFKQNVTLAIILIHILSTYYPHSYPHSYPQINKDTIPYRGIVSHITNNKITAWPVTSQAVIN